MAPESIKVRKSSRCVEFTFDGDTTALSFEFLRVYSPSAEVRGHGIGNGVLQTGKKDVVLLQMEPSAFEGKLLQRTVVDKVRSLVPSPCSMPPPRRRAPVE